VQNGHNIWGELKVSGNIFWGNPGTALGGNDSTPRQASELTDNDLKSILMDPRAEV